MEIKIREIGSGDRTWALELFRTRWGSDLMVTRGRKHYYDELGGFIAEINGEKKGLITYRLENEDIEIISLDSLLEGRGVGTGLINRVRELADRIKARRIWLITTNDNIDALRFYQKRGFGLVRIYPGAIGRSRKIKPAIPEVGNYGVPIRDEIELEMKLRINK